MAIKLIRDPGKKIELLLSRKKENMQEKKSANQKIKKKINSKQRPILMDVTWSPQALRSRPMLLDVKPCPLSRVQ